MATEEPPKEMPLAGDGAASRTRESVSGALLALSGFVFGLVSLTYPFGRDQGLYFYVAREWVRRGSIPYRDVLDHKTPGIYFLHALSILLFGENAWGIRLIELFGVAVCGALAAAIASPRETPLRRDVLGAGALAMSLFYFGSFDFWDTAQSEIWYTLFGFAAVACARRVPSLVKASVLAGLFSGAAVIMKPPAIWFVFVAAAVLASRVYASNDRSLKTWLLTALRFGACSAAIPVVVLGYFALHGALSALVDIVVGANGYYVKHERGAANVSEAIWGGVRHFAPLSVVLPIGALLGVAAARRDRDRAMLERCVLGLALLVAGFLATAMQGKFYLLHQGSMIGPLAVLAIAALLNAEAIGKGALGFTSGGVLLVALFCTSAWTGGGLATWKASVQTAWAYRHGEMSREDYVKTFRRPSVAFWYDQTTHIADWISAHTTPEDNITIRGFEPQIYALTGRRHVGRFFWTTFIVNPDRAYRREEWLAEDDRDITAHPPKYIVSIDWVHEGVDSKEWAEKHGYERVELFGDAAIMAKVR